MFEDSLFASQNRATSPNTRWSTVFSLVVQAMLAAIVIVFPLLHPALLPHRSDAIQLALPLPKQPPPPTVIQRASTGASSLIPAIGHLLQVPRIAPTRIDASPDPTPSTAFGSPLGASTLTGALFGTNTGTNPRVSVAPTAEKKPGPVRVSAGVSAGLLLTPIRPVYPQIARAAHVEGSVVVAATISKTQVPSRASTSSAAPPCSSPPRSTPSAPPATSPFNSTVNQPKSRPPSPSTSR